MLRLDSFAVLTALALCITAFHASAEDAAPVNDNLPPRTNASQEFAWTKPDSQTQPFHETQLVGRTPTIMQTSMQQWPVPVPPAVPIPDDIGNLLPTVRVSQQKTDTIGADKPRVLTPVPEPAPLPSADQPSPFGSEPVDDLTASEDAVLDLPTLPSLNAEPDAGLPAALPSLVSPVPSAATYVQQSGPSDCRGCRSCYRCVSDELDRMVTAYAGATFMTRSTPSYRPLFVNGGRPTQSINAADFDFGVHSGVEAGVIAHGCAADAELDVDLRFFSTGDINTTERQTFSGNGALVSTPAQFAVTGPRFATVNYSSSLSSFEANLRYRYGGGTRWTTFLAGLRYLSLNEDISGQFADPTRRTRTAIADVEVDNHLVGLQIGLNRTMFSDDFFSLELYGRAGIYGNSSRSAMQLQRTSPVIQTTRIKGSGGQSSFVGELGAKAAYRLSDAWNIYGRYQWLFVDDIAVAGQQSVRHSAHGEALFHGAVCGVEYIY